MLIDVAGAMRCHRLIPQARDSCTEKDHQSVITSARILRGGCVGAGWYAGSGRSVALPGSSGTLLIGDFACYDRVSVWMLRHYDSIDLLRPAYADPASPGTGHR